MNLSFVSSVQSLLRGLNSNSILVSDATISLLSLARKQAMQSTTFGSTTEFFSALAEALSAELLGYANPDWDLETSYRRCKVRTAKMVANELVFVPNTLGDCSLVMMYGSQQVEAMLADIMDLSVFKSGQQQKVDSAIEQLMEHDCFFHTESGVDDTWVVFTGSEVARLYMQLKSTIIDFCELLIERESSGNFVPNPNFAQTGITISWV